MDPTKAFNCLNDLQREVCPDAYEPEVVVVQRLKQEAIEKAQKEQLEYMQEMDRTLFDFDDEVDNLSEVSERYRQHQAGGMAPDSDKIVVVL